MDVVEKGKIQSVLTTQNEKNVASDAPLYTMMLALQDTTEYMAPMNFL